MSKFIEPFVPLPRRVIVANARQWGVAGLLLYMLAECDRATGTIERWTDAAAAAELGMPPRTLRAQRKALEESGVIAARKNQHYQKIFVTDALFPATQSAPESGKSLTLSSIPEWQDFTADLPERCHPTYSQNQREDSRAHARPSAASRSKKHPARDNRLYPTARALANVCGMSFEANRSRLFREAKLLSEAMPTPTPELITAHYNGNPKAYWRAQDWRGKKGEKPSLSAIRETWGQWEQAEQQTNNRKPFAVKVTR